MTVSRTVELTMRLSQHWLRETHTFHLPLGEAIITLLDVALLTRLPIEGRALSTTGRLLSSYRYMVRRILGDRLPAIKLKIKCLFFEIS